MERDYLSRKLAVLVHADVTGSTSLVQKNETLAHERIQGIFRRFSEIISNYGGAALEIRGDALVAEFAKASDAVGASLAFQTANTILNEQISDDIRPVLRIGIAMGEVVVADNTVTGDGIVLAQRLEQLAEAGGVVIQGAAHETLPRRLPFDFTDLGEQSLKGFEAPVRAFSVALSAGAKPPEPELNTRASAVRVAGDRFSSGEKPAIAVLSFESTDDPAFGVDLANDIIVELGRFGSFSVTAPHSSFVYSGQSLGVVDIAEQLGVKYVVEGRVQISGNRLRVSIQLSDGATGQQLWAERYKRETEDMFEVHDDIVEVVSASLEHKIESREASQKMRVDDDMLSAYDFYTKGREIFFSRTREANAESKRLIEQAISMDDQLARAHGFLAFVYIYEYRNGWSDDPQQSLDLAMQSARKAFSLDPADAACHWRLGSCYLHRREFDRAITEYEKARAGNPNHAGFLAEGSTHFLMTGQMDKAIDQIQRAMRVNPNHPEWFFAQLAWAQLEAGDEDTACATFAKINNLPTVYFPLYIDALMRTNKSVEAIEKVRILLQQEPDYSVRVVGFMPYQDESRATTIADSLRAAGVPE